MASLNLTTLILRRGLGFSLRISFFTPLAFMVLWLVSFSPTWPRIALDSTLYVAEKGEASTKNVITQEGWSTRVSKPDAGASCGKEWGAATMSNDPSSMESGKRMGSPSRWGSITSSTISFMAIFVMVVSVLALQRRTRLYHPLKARTPSSL